MPSRHFSTAVSLVVILLLLGQPLRLPADLRISEFMASNSKTLMDEDRTYQDWIEIENTDTNTVSIGGWYLTDSAAALTKWRFPATNLPPNGFLLVFASGKDRRLPGAPLHASFRLASGGSYLGLVAADGQTVASEFTPFYPPQIPDIAYGFGMITTNVMLVASNATARALVPLTAGDSSEGWNAAGFDDSLWGVVTNGIGFGSTNAQPDYGAVVLGTAPFAYWRLNEGPGTNTLINLGSAGGIAATYQGPVTLAVQSLRPPTFKGFETNNVSPSFNGLSSYADSGQSLLNNLAAFSMGGWIRPTGTQLARTGLFGQNDCVEFGFIDATTLQVWTPTGGSLNVAYPFAANTWHHVAVVGDGNSLRLFLDGQQAGAVSGATPSYGSSGDPFRIGGGGIFDPAGNFFKGGVDEVFVHHRALGAGEVLALYQAGTNSVGIPVGQLVRTDLAPRMLGQATSAFLRIPFVVDNPRAFSLLTLRMRYDDGFIAWLNGQEFARGNVADPVDWISSATGTHSAAVVEEFKAGIGSLVTGTNVLAVQGVNVGASDPDFFVQAELLATSIAQESPSPGYLLTATPGGPNGPGSTNPGPAILTAAHAPNVPTDDQDLVVTARVQPTFHGVGTVRMLYRVMFGPTVTNVMFDDGVHGDGLPGDGIYGALIPASASTNGQMIRYAILAADTNGAVSRFPLFGNPADSAEFLGTIVDDPSLSSKLPIVHLFVDPKQQAAVDGQTGGRMSVFHDGEFYDNVQMQVRGNSTAGYDKKSHRLEFDHDHAFRHPGPGGRINKTSFTADYPDPAYMRQGLSFWLCGLMGAPGPFYYPMRLQLNTQFYQLANHNDVHGEELLSRIGYDPNGALYNAAGIVATSQSSTGGFEKKTRRWEGVQDYTAFAGGIAETLSTAQRMTNAFETMDLPEVINYLVVARWTQENDDVWANMSLYHDNDGDDLWRIVPFDMNLSWGAAFGTGDPVDNGLMITNDNHKSFPLYGGSKSPALTGGDFNRLYDAIYAIPQTREMFLRRMRTLLDTYIGPPGTPTNTSPVERYALAWRDLIAEEAARDRAKWKWPPNGGQSNFDPGIGLTNGVSDVLDKFLQIRRLHFYGKHGVNNTALPIGINKDQNAGIPVAQPPDVLLRFQGLEANPASGNQDQEYVCITNPMPFAVDISGWTVSGAIRHTFHPGTVIPTAGTLYLSPDLRGFRTRTTGPGPRQGLFVQAPYQGHLSAWGGTLVLGNPSGRVVDTLAYPGNPSDAQRFLRVTEIAYHPSSRAGDATPPDEFEYVELSNTSPTVTLALSGIRFTRGILFDFTAGSVASLAPGESVLVVKNLAAARSLYGPSVPIAGVYLGSLDNNGERLTLVDARGEEIMDFSYDNHWQPLSDGLGFSLVPAHPGIPLQDWGSAAAWRLSARPGGSPGASDPAPPAILPVTITEALTRSDSPLMSDRVELHNPTLAPADISGWWLSDDFRTPNKFRFPNGTIIAPGGYLVVAEEAFNSGPAGFGLGADGDEIHLFSADSAGLLTGYTQGWAFGAADDLVTFGLHVTSDGRSLFVAQSTATLGAANSGPRVGPVVISEISYNPPAGPGSADEFIELLNISPLPVGLFDSASPTNTWVIQGGVQLAFGTNLVLEAGERLVVVGFDPVADPAAAAGFRARNALAAGTRLAGPYAGRLSNGGDLIELGKPAPPSASGPRFIVIDRVSYQDSSPWPSTADGFGLTLQRSPTDAFGDDPASWVAAPPTPGAPLPSIAPPSIASQPAALSVGEGQDATFQVRAGGVGPFSYQWFLDGTAIAGATGSLLRIPAATPESTGSYTVLVYNAGGSLLSLPAALEVHRKPLVVLPPRGVQVRVQPDPAALATTNATFVVLAYAPGPLSYQWRHDGVDIPGATGPALTLSDVKISDGGNYSVLVTDDYGTVSSVPAPLVPLVSPVIVLPPLDQSVAPGRPVTFSVGVTGSPIPFGFEWRRGTTLLASNTVYDTVAYFSFTSTNIATNQVFKVTVRNLALGGATVFATNTLTVLADADKDGMPDTWELSHGFNPGDLLDGAADSDGDGMSNAAEYAAGTDPADAGSRLHLDVVPAPGGGSLTLAFTAQPARTYSVQYREASAEGSWRRLMDLPARSAVRIESVQEAWGQTNRFYRVITPRQP